MTIEQLQLINLAIPVVFGLVGMVWGIIATILNHKSVPMSEVHAFLNRSEGEAAKSDNPLDDEAVRIAKTIVQALADLGLLPTTPDAEERKNKDDAYSQPLHDPSENRN